MGEEKPYWRCKECGTYATSENKHDKCTECESLQKERVI